VTTPPPLTQADLQARLHSHLAGHYLQIHGTLVSIALGAAAFAAASLGMPEHGQPEGGVLPWLLWSGGLLAIAVVFAGTVTGAFMLPGGIPSVLDLLIPLATGLCQFAVFGVLTHSVADFTSGSHLVEAWFFAMTGVGLCAVLGIVRARLLVGPSRFDVSASAAATYYRQRLSRDTKGAASLVVVSGLGGAFRAAGVPSASAWSYVFASAALCIMVVGLVMHEITGRRLRTLIG